MIEFCVTVDADSVREYMPDVPVLLSAASFYRRRSFLQVPSLPEHVTRRRADCGGFVAARRWGEYPFSPMDYVCWLYGWLLLGDSSCWAATFDYCCEPETRRGLTRSRQSRTLDRAYEFWDAFGWAPWTWVPTIQGWDVDDYRRHAASMAPLVYEMASEYKGRSNGDNFRVGIGTLCRRLSPRMIVSVIEAVVAELPGINFHLWGVKADFLTRVRADVSVVSSFDTAAWNGQFYAERGVQRASGLSQREYAYGVALPEYLAKVDRALGSLASPSS